MANRLSLNIKKTKYMIFHTYQTNTDYLTSNITLIGNVLERVDTFNFLGVILDKHLSWKAHVEMVSNNISRYCGILTKLKNYIPLDILRTLYFSMIHSHLNYGLIAWGHDCNRLIKLQKRSIRNITRSESVRNIKLTWYVTPKYSQFLLQIRAQRNPGILFLHLL